MLHTPKIFFAANTQRLIFPKEKTRSRQEREIANSLKHDNTNTALLQPQINNPPVTRIMTDSTTHYSAAKGII
jgi:hypothetical protein